MKKPKGPKLPTGVTQEFLDEIQSFDSAGLEQRIVQMQKDIDEAQTFLKEKEEIVDLREQLKQIEGPSRDAIKVLRNRTKWIVDQLKPKGI